MGSSPVDNVMTDVRDITSWQKAVANGLQRVTLSTEPDLITSKMATSITELKAD